MKKQFKKIILTFFIILNILSISIPSVCSADIDLGDVVDAIDNMQKIVNPIFWIPSILETIQTQLGFKISSVKNVAEMAESLQYKFDAPRVSLSFNPSSPVVGQRTTATAQTEYFKTPDKEMYFTWFLKSSNCPKLLDGTGKERIIQSGEAEFSDTCDLDNDDDIDINDYKIKAARIIANAGFNWEEEKYETASNDSDGFYAPFGGSANQYKETYMFLYNTKSGLFYPDQNYQLTYETQGYVERSSANTVTTESCTCGTQGTTRTRSCPIYTEDGEPIKEQCEEDAQWGNITEPADGDTDCHWAYWCIDTGLDLPQVCHWENPGGGIVAYEVCEPDPRRVKCENYILDYECGCQEEVEDCVTDEDESWRSDQRADERNYLINNTRNGIEDPVHLFPHSSDVEDDDGTDLGLKDSGSSNKEIGNFSIDQEKFWRTNPNDQDTGDYGQPDEASVIGLGMNKFSWTYQEGDEIGVVVEGTSYLPAKSKMSGISEITSTTAYSNMGQGDSAYKITWAFSGKGCKPDKIGDSLCDTDNDDEDNDFIDQRDEDCEERSIDHDINRYCLPNSFVSPTQKGEYDKLDITLNYYPEFPTNNPENIDIKNVANMDFLQLHATTTLENGVNKNLFYKWSIYKGNGSDPESEDWTPITKDSLSGVERTSGAGLDTLSLPLNFADNPNYLKVRVSVSMTGGENGDEMINRGGAVVVVPLTPYQDKIKFYSVDVIDDGSLLPKLQKKSLICEESTDCYVSRNQIIAAEINKDKFQDFQWLLNGEAISYSFLEMASKSENNEEAPNLVFFPVPKNAQVGTKFILALKTTEKPSEANNNKGGKQQTFKKTFSVIEPDIRIFCKEADKTEGKCAPEIMGFFKDYNGQEWPDESNNSIEIMENQSVTLEMRVAGFIPNSDVVWSIPEISTYFKGKETTINLSDEKYANLNNFNMYVQTSYGPSDLEKKALNNYWDFQYADFYEKNLSTESKISIVSVLNESETEMVKRKVNKPVASLFSGASLYFIFLFKITLCAVLMIFLLGIISAIVPATRI